MLKKLDFQSDTMAVALVIWLCTLPLVAIIVVPFFGTKVAALVAVTLFFTIMAVCWGKCGWKIFKSLISYRKQYIGKASDHNSH